MTEYRVLKQFGDHELNSVVELGGDQSALVSAGILEVAVDNDFSDVIKSAAKEFRNALREDTNGRKETVNKGFGNVEVKDPQVDPKGGFHDIGHFFHDVAKVKSHGHSNHLSQYIQDREVVRKAVAAQYGQKAAQGMNETVDSDGGIIVPEEFSSAMFERAVETGDILKLVDPIPMQSNTLKLSAFKDHDRSSSLYGGVITYWEGEAGQFTSSKPAFRELRLNTKKLTGLCFATDEMLEDSPISAAAIINRVFPASLNFKMDQVILRGTGVGMPKGVLDTNTAATLAVAKKSGQAADTLVWDNIINMYSKMPAASKRNAVWVIANDVWPQLMSLQVPTGDGAAVVWLMDAKGQPVPTLLGRPIIESEHSYAVGDRGDILFADFTQYLMGIKGGVKTASSIHLRFDYEETAFRFSVRCDGMSWLDTPLTLANGNQQSPFVTLAARA